MPIVNAKSTFGNFKWIAKCEVSEVVRDILADLGFLWVMQRTPSSNAEKALAGYEKRPAGFKRSEIDFSDENAKTLAGLLAEAVEIELVVGDHEEVPGRFRLQAVTPQLLAQLRDVDL